MKQIKNAFKCSKCGLIYQYEKQELETFKYGDQGEITVVCPNCHTRNLLWQWKGYNEEEK